MTHPDTIEAIGRNTAHHLLDQIDLDTTPEQLTILLQSVMANVIAGMIDAGSERDAVMENEGLTEAISDEVNGWYTPDGWRP